MKLNNLNQLYSDRELCNAVLCVTVGGFGIGALFFAPEILLAVSVMGGIAYILWVKHSAIQLEFRDRRAEIMKKETQARFVSVVSRQGVLTFDSDSGLCQFFTRESGARPNSQGGIGYQGSQTDGEPDQGGFIQRPSVMPFIRDALSLVILGPQGTGKTTLLCHLIDARQDGRAVILDPHGYPGKYNGHEITGAGRDYQAVNDAMDWIMSEINRRYQDYYRRDYEPIHVYIDEATLLKKNCESFQGFMEIMLTESRKVRISLTLCLHSRRAKFLGLHGAMDLAEGVHWLTLKNEGGVRWAEMETETGNIELELPGPYQGGYYYHHDAPEPESDRNADRNAQHPCRNNHDFNVLQGIGYDRQNLNSDQQQVVYDCLYDSETPLRAIDISNATGLDNAYTRVTLSRLVKTGIVHRNNDGAYSVWRGYGA